VSGAVYHLGLIGYPLGHSRSPELHHAALQVAGFSGEYRLFPITPDAQGEAAIHSLIEEIRHGTLHGLNVTIPHKKTVIPYLDQMSEVARAVGAVNTIYRDSTGRVIGDNTDVPGFLQAVQPVLPPQRGRALVMGAGGSARAVVYALATSGWQVTVLARREEQASSLAEEIGAEGLKDLISPMAWSNDAFSQLRSVRLVVNTTPVGMFPHVDECPWPEDLALPSSAGVYDLIYNPVVTDLIRRAKQAGLQACSGAGMLVAQAALAFQRWTGCEPPYQVMQEAMQASLTNPFPKETL
jgi:shikimate dehydrogenase